MLSRSSAWLVSLALLATMVSPGRLAAQEEFLEGLQVDVDSNLAGKDEKVVTIEAEFTPATGKQPARIYVTANMAEGWHIYSITQLSGGPIRTEINLDPSPHYKRLEDFKPSPAPKAHSEPAFKGLLVEEHTGRVTWYAPIQLTEGVDPAELKIVGKVRVQACNQANCRPPENFPLAATLGKGVELLEDAAAPTAPTPDTPPRASTSYTNPRVGTVVTGRLSPLAAVPEGKARLAFTVTSVKEWHVYPLVLRDPAKVSRPTLIVLTEKSGMKASQPVASAPPVEKPPVVEGGDVERYHEGTVTWTIDLDVPEDAMPKESLTIKGLFAYQTCKGGPRGQCDRPEAIPFSVQLPIDFASTAGEIPVIFGEPTGYDEAADLVEGPALPPNAAGLDLNQIAPANIAGGQQNSLWLMMGFGFLGGLILNLMPCVLPVIGLKVLSFVEQSGHDRKHIFMLNLWYSLGLLSVFMALATLPVVYRLVWNQQFGWGQQFAYDGFNITLTAIVFVMALSFLGVWEIPIPGFVGSGKANDLAAREGAAGAFFKGALTTVLATPCSGPFLGTALGFAVTEPPLITYTMFASIGVGMASPYLLIGAFPALIRFLPKPGAWMDTFKQSMGFILLGTVVYLMTLLKWPTLVPTLLLLFGLWAGCWWVGRTPLFVDFPTKARAWLGGAALATIVGIVSFQWLGPIMVSRFQRDIDIAVAKQLNDLDPAEMASRGSEPAHNAAELPWKPFSQRELEKLTRQNRTVMVDFTADWCVTCKTLERLVLNTPETSELVKANGIEVMVADVTRYPADESALLEKVNGGSRLVPVLAIFPAGRPNKPIVLNKTYTKGWLLEKLREAGPSQPVAEQTTTAMK